MAREEPLARVWYTRIKERVMGSTLSRPVTWFPFVFLLLGVGIPAAKVCSVTR